jgi:hypothetical protein
MSAPATPNEIDPLLHPAQVAKLQVPDERYRTPLRETWTSGAICPVRGARVHQVAPAKFDQRGVNAR